jgi:dTDP-4-dehydrorhamnose reductase
MKIVVLGSNGMLGHKMIERLRLHYSDVIGISRGDAGFDAMDFTSVRQVLESIKPHVVINCIGLIKQRVQNPEQSIAINALLPHFLQRICMQLDAHLIHFSTDCVFSGERGQYTEDDKTDPEDIYGQTKVLGEVSASNALTLRTSIIGREKNNYHGLLEWFLRQEDEIQGFERAIWSGVTTNWLSDTVAVLLAPARLLHLYGLYQVAAPPITKFHLLQLFQEVYKKRNVLITPVAGPLCDRSLCGDKFMQATGIITPSLDKLIVEMHEQDKGSDYVLR